MLNDQATYKCLLVHRQLILLLIKNTSISKLKKIEEMNISANSNTLDSELEYANVDMRKTLEPFGLEMWPGATNGKDFDNPSGTPIASLPALYYISEKTGASIWIVPTLPKSIRMLNERD